MLTMFDLTHLTVITESDLVEAVRSGFKEIMVNKEALLTVAACEYLRTQSICLLANGIRNREPESAVLKNEMMRAGRKLWARHYVDGSGGNLSARLNDQRIICTPSFCCKGDMTMDDFAVVDMQAEQKSGVKPRSSEILLHLSIYQAVPQAQAVIHCHPPHALAYAITGTLPPAAIVPEYEVFIGSVVLVPYETPGTAEFAASVLPYVQSHNMILLQNHGIVCWADSIMHAEWMVEVFDAHCRALILASQLGAPVTPIPASRLAELKEIRKKLGLPIL
jgi:L-fuculose-phosphate aldolase